MDDGEGSQITLVGSFQKNQLEAVCAGVNEWRGKNYFFLRIFTPVIGSEELVPTKKGVSLEYKYIDDFLDGVKKLGEIMGGDQVVKTIKKGQNQEIRICSSSYQGQSLLDIRLYIQPDGKSNLIATRKGLSIRTEQFPLLFEVVQNLHKYVKSEAEL